MQRRFPGNEVGESDEGPYFSINKNKNIVLVLMYNSEEFPNHPVINNYVQTVRKKNPCIIIHEGEMYVLERDHIW